MREREFGKLWGKGTPKYIDTYQKSYIVGLVPCTVAQPLAAFLKTKPVYFEMYRAKPFQKIHDTFPTERYVLTQWRACTREADLAFEPWDEYTIRRPFTDPADLHTSYFREYPQIFNMLERDCVQVTVAGRQFGEGSVEDVLLEFFRITF